MVKFTEDPLKWIGDLGEQKDRFFITKIVCTLTFVALTGIFNSIIPLDTAPLTGLPAFITTGRILSVLMGLVVFWMWRRSI